MLGPYGSAGARTMRTAREQAELFLRRANEIEAKARSETDEQLQGTLLLLAEYYRRLVLSIGRSVAPRRLRCYAR